MAGLALLHLPEQAPAMHINRHGWAAVAGAGGVRPMPSSFELPLTRQNGSRMHLHCTGRAVAGPCAAGLSTAEAWGVC